MVEKSEIITILAYEFQFVRTALKEVIELSKQSMETALEADKKLDVLANSLETYLGINTDKEINEKGGDDQ